MRKINFNIPITNLDGVAMKKDAQNDLMIKDIVANSLCIAKAVKNTEVVRQLAVAIDIHKAVSEINLDDTDIKMIREVLINADLSTLVLGQIIKLLDSK